MPSSPTACSREPGGAFSIARRKKRAASSRCTRRPALRAVADVCGDALRARELDEPLREAAAPAVLARAVHRAWQRTTDDRTPRSASASVMSSAGARSVEIGFVRSPASASVAARPRHVRRAGRDRERPVRAREHVADRRDRALIDRARLRELGEVVDERRVDHAVGRLGASAQAVEILERAAHDGRACRGERVRVGVGADEPEHLVPRAQQFTNGGAADEAGRAGDEDTHGHILRPCAAGEEKPWRYTGIMTDRLRMANGDDNPLGAYLKDRRKKLDPAAFGFSVERRRTPGLRREEVAQRANVSATWYTWLEQGRGGAPSADVLDRIARALALSDVEREHVFLLALGHPPEVRRGPVIACEITPPLQRVLDAIESHPALLATSTWDIVGWNAAATVVFTDYGAVPADQRNTLRFMFAPGARAHAHLGAPRARGGRGVSRRDCTHRRDRSRDGARRRAIALEPGVRRDVARTRRRRAGPRHRSASCATTATITFDSSSFAVHGHIELHMMVFTPSTPADAVRLRELLKRRGDPPRSATE